MNNLNKKFLTNGYLVLKNKTDLKKYNFNEHISIFDEYLGIKSNHIKDISKRIDFIADKSALNKELKKKFKEIYIGIFQRSIISYRLAIESKIINLLKKLELKVPYLASDPLLMLSGKKIDKCLGMVTHSPIHQDWASMQSSQNSIVVWLPLTNYGTKEFSTITPEDAINHPVWKMGKKISVDSSTLMNKGLEIIEARWLFDCENIEVLIHPEGIIHSLVEFKDNSVLAQLSNPDMKIPIAYGLGYPDRINSGSSQLNLHELKSLNFQEPDTRKFPCLKLATDLLSVGGTSFSILNASNEECVAAFLDGRISYMQIYEIISKVLDRIEIKAVQSLQDIFESDKESRLETTSIINN